MTHADYRDMLVAIAGAAGALTGLLFVASSGSAARGSSSAISTPA
jgi:hypothetical protein